MYRLFSHRMLQWYTFMLPVTDKPHYVSIKTYHFSDYNCLLVDLFNFCDALLKVGKNTLQFYIICLLNGLIAINCDTSHIMKINFMELRVKI